ncbi:MAG TPA: LLM class flavin-dependent oxidoreductase [Candidatus Limnocylindria bacterium]|jgi:alkanesulfonate monooxygenase SsuD/methylene tetrahydromethanopterin reductase-like flavin-dependent oxidoreductase (luciferase family)|nr:LLM class flavin-dependent oxidoreductase [Candidatus Limnocylindria bacterium]
MPEASTGSESWTTFSRSAATVHPRWIDVLSGGRATLGIGAAWNEYEARSLGIPFPPIAERFDWLEDALEPCRRIWSDDQSRFVGKRFVAERPLNRPRA